MGNIIQLPENLINLIAAGEVVERPASIVKELVENSIDSGATRVVIKLEEGGNRSIQIEDNGCGMDSKDAVLSLTQHATSKLKTAADLQQIATMGFRGEALASISSVADIMIDTFNGSDTATKIISVSDSLEHSESSKSVIGTTVRVSNLFNRIPARKKFLKSSSTELRYITDSFISTALAHPDIHFELHHNGKKIYSLPRSTEIKTRIYDIWGAEISEHLYINRSEGNSRAGLALLGSPQIARKDRRRQFIFVNNRPISDKLIQKAISDGYQGFIHRDQQPVYFIFLHIPPDEVDVNVHPRKLEVRFNNTQEIYKLVYHLVRNTLMESTKSELTSRVSNQTKEVYAPKSYSPTISSKPAQSSRESVSQALSFTKQLLQPQHHQHNLVKSEYTHQFQPQTNPIQIFNTYIVYENQDQVVFVDQHAAAESIAYERVIASSQLSRSKPLLVPTVIEFSSQEKERLLEMREVLVSIGIEISDFGGNSINVKSTPEALKSFESKQFLQEFLNMNFDHGDLNIEIDLTQNLEIVNPKLHTLIATMACHGSIRAGQRLSVPEMQQILRDLEKGSNTYNCPHGRPVSWTLSKGELEKNFSRIL